MMRTFVYGASGHGKVVADILLTWGDHELAGFVDDDTSLSGSTLMDMRIVGPEQLRSEAANGNIGVALGVGDNRTRKKLTELCRSFRAHIVTAIHPAAAVSRSALIQEGTVVMAGAVINPYAQIGVGVIINSGAVIEHDV